MNSSKESYSKMKDRQLTISVGTSRKASKWSMKKLSWSELSLQLSKTLRTKETMAEFRALPKSQQDEIKDVGGFVGGLLKDGRRHKGFVKRRDVITLDADHVAKDMWKLIQDNYDFACCVYSTHKHTSKAPRLRVVIPLSRGISADLYEPISRKIAETLGIELFDDTTYQCHRLMYWPSTSSDAEYYFKEQDGELLDPQSILDEYEADGLDAHDPFHWPHSSREDISRRREIARAGDPTEKPGMIGAFCRTYDVPAAIDEFLSDKYTRIQPGRYSYAEGSTAGGLVLYEDGNFCYSHHESDPAGGRLSNAFDLVRLHMFGDLDGGKEDGGSPTKLPSYKKMVELVQSDELVKKTNFADSLAQAADDFKAVGDESEDEEDESGDWMTQLELDKKGACEQTINNARLVLENDKKLKGAIAYNQFTNGMTIKSDLPWHKMVCNEGDRWADQDDAGLRLYLERGYGLTFQAKISDALTVVSQKNAYHPIKDYLNALKWDGDSRVDTLLIDYLGAEDSEYVRAVTRKTLVAAVARIMNPGVKFDNMLVLFGSQGIGKSYIIKQLAGVGRWYSDSMNTVQGREAYEQLLGVWLLEVAELSATRKAEAEAVKHFISKSEDMYRAAYGRHVSKVPRQCIFIGTTNDKDFLRDRTGNRRFWPVTVGEELPLYDVFTDLDDAAVGQIWAEAVELYNAGEKLYLRGEMARMAEKAQAAHLEDNPIMGQIQEYLDMPLPDDWDELDTNGRRMYISGSEFGKAERTGRQRDRVCAIEIMKELLGKDEKSMKYQADSREIVQILRSLPDWYELENSNKGRIRFGYYGRQKAFIRKGTKI